MGKIRSLTPFINNDTTKIRISQGEINEIQRGYLLNDHDFWQSCFRMFEYMTLTTNQTYRLTSFVTQASQWNQYKSCIGYKSNGSFDTSTTEFKPCISYNLQQWCYDELLGSCWEHFLTVDGGSGDLELTTEGTRVWNQITDELIYSSSLGLSNTLAVGNLYQGVDITYIDENLTAEEKKKAHASLTQDSCRGWVTLLDDLAADGKTWLNCGNELLNEGDFDNLCNYGGDFGEVIEALICKARPKLRKIINGGNRGRVNGRRMQAQIWVSDSFYNAAIQFYDKEAKRCAQNEMCIRKESKTAAGMTKDVYYIKNMPIIPICDINAHDDKLKGETHFIGIFVSGVIQLGTSFGRIGQDLNSRDTAVIIQRNTDVSSRGLDQNGVECFEYGKTTMLSHALTDVRMADWDCAVAAFSYYQ